MARSIRYVPPGGGTFEITCTTLQRRFLLRPSPEINELILGVLGKALERYPVIRLHAFVYLSNHATLLVTTPDAKALSGFMGYLDGNIAREIARHLGWRERIWGRRPAQILIRDDAKLLERFRYVLAQGCKEGLVRSPQDWPGATSVHALLDGRPLEGVWYDRTAEYKSRNRKSPADRTEFATRVAVPLAPLPGWEGLPLAERQEKCREVVQSIIDAAETERNARPALGASMVLRQRPEDRPKDSKRSPMPYCHASTLEGWIAHRQEYDAFLACYRVASKRLRSGDYGAITEFPPGCFPPALPFWSGTHMRSS